MKWTWWVKGFDLTPLGGQGGQVKPPNSPCSLHVGTPNPPPGNSTTDKSLLSGIADNLLVRWIISRFKLPGTQLLKPGNNWHRNPSTRNITNHCLQSTLLSTGNLKILFILLQNCMNVLRRAASLRRNRLRWRSSNSWWRDHWKELQRIGQFGTPWLVNLLLKKKTQEEEEEEETIRISLITAHRAQRKYFRPTLRWNEPR